MIELQAQAKDYAMSRKLNLSEPTDITHVIGLLENAYIAGAEPREKRIAELEVQIEEMKCCGNCDHYRWSNGDDWCNDHYGQPTYDEECKGKWKLRR